MLLLLLVLLLAAINTFEPLIFHDLGDSCPLFRIRIKHSVDEFLCFKLETFEDIETAFLCTFPY